MNLRQLQYFVEVGEVQSITKAAARLNLAQPALTRHMRALEFDLGVRLLTRSGRGIALTNAGTVFLDRIKGILRDLERARIEAEAASRLPGGQIGLGLPASISRSLTRAVLQRFRAQLPDMQVRIIDGWSGFIVEWLLLGRLDLGVIYDFAQRSDLLHIEPLAMEEQFLIGRTSDPLMGRSRHVPLKSVARLPLILPSRQHGLRLAFDEHMRANGLSSRVEMEVESVFAIKQFVEAGEAYTVLPRGEIEQELAAGQLTLLPTRPAYMRTLSLAWPRDRTSDTSLLALIEIVRQETARLIDTGEWGTTFLGPRSARADNS